MCPRKRGTHLLIKVPIVDLAAWKRASLAFQAAQFITPNWAEALEALTKETESWKPENAQNVPLIPEHSPDAGSGK